MSNSRMLDAALDYAEHGFAVFPLKPHEKFPLTPNGFKNASKDPVQIRRWWNRSPEANIGIATGEPSGNVIVIDIDNGHADGVYGSDSIADWQRSNGRLPDTASTITGSGGYHMLYRVDGEYHNRAGIIEGVDLRADGGYIVAPPSIHPNGREYEWEYDYHEYPVADADETVLKFISSASPKNPKAIEEYKLPEMVGVGGRNDFIYKVACSLQAKKLDDETIMLAVKNENRKKCNPPLSDEEVEKTVTSALGHPKGPSKEFQDNKPRKKRTEYLEDIKAAILQDPLLGKSICYNSLAYCPYIKGAVPWGYSGAEYREWTDTDDYNFFAYMETKYGFTNQNKMREALEIVMDMNHFSPVIEHLESLPKWDGNPRIATMLQDCLGAEDTPLTSEIMKLFMMGAIARAYKPGTKFDYMLIIVGEQAAGKSTFLSRLAMKQIWFDDNFNTIDGTQAVERLRGMWIVEMGELLSFKRAREVEAIKSFITSRGDNFRAPYARRTAVRKRQCVFSGTTNSYHFLTDPTGNRRFLPVKAVKKDKQKIDVFSDDPKIEQYFEQAWAEALYIYKTENPKLFLPKRFEKEILELQKLFTEEDVRIGMIQAWLDATTKDRVCVMDIWEKALHNDKKPDHRESNQIHDIMRNQISGWEPVGVQRTSEYGHQRCYERVKIEGFQVVNDAPDF